MKTVTLHHGTWLIISPKNHARWSDIEKALQTSTWRVEPPSFPSCRLTVYAFPTSCQLRSKKSKISRKKLIDFKLGPVLKSVAKSHANFLPPLSVLCCEMALSLVLTDHSCQSKCHVTAMFLSIYYLIVISENNRMLILKFGRTKENLRCWDIVPHYCIQQVSRPRCFQGLSFGQLPYQRVSAGIKILTTTAGMIWVLR